MPLEMDVRECFCLANDGNDFQCWGRNSLHQTFQVMSRKLLHIPQAHVCPRLEGANRQIIKRNNPELSVQPDQRRAQYRFLWGER